MATAPKPQGCPPRATWPDQLVNSALHYRGQAPLVDSLLADIGLGGGDLNAVTQVLRGDQPPAQRPPVKKSPKGKPTKS